MNRKGIDMERRTVYFHSEGDQIEAFLYLPSDMSTPPPVVVLAGGWCYVKELVQPIYAEAFAEAGLAVLLFDYRRLGGSEGEPRQHLNPWDQIEDYRNAISYLETLPEVDASRVGVWGISYSGGHVLIVGAIDPRVKAVVAIVPVVDGYQNLRLAHGTVGFRRLRAQIAESRKRRYETGEDDFMPHGSADPVADLVTWPFPASQPTFAYLKETQAPAYENRATVRSTEMLLGYSVEGYIHRLTDIPTMMVVAEQDDHTHWDLEIDVFNRIPSGKKTLQVVEKSGHLGLYRDPERIGRVAVDCAKWFVRWL